jgi:hypothetical protein
MLVNHEPCCAQNFILLRPALRFLDSMLRDEEVDKFPLVLRTLNIYAKSYRFG